MICPKCNQDLQTQIAGTVEIDVCEKCNGIWFDEDELRKCKDQADMDLNWMDFDLWKHEGHFRVSEHEHKCPKCQIEMAAIDYDKTDIEIDFCVKCKGVWLDGGEFEKIIDSLAEELLTKSSLEYLKTTLSEAKEIITGPEGFISEWRDFLTVIKFLETRFFIENPKLAEILKNFQKNSPFI